MFSFQSFWAPKVPNKVHVIIYEYAYFLVYFILIYIYIFVIYCISIVDYALADIYCFLLQPNTKNCENAASRTSKSFSIGVLEYC